VFFFATSKINTGSRWLLLLISISFRVRRYDEMARVMAKNNLTRKIDKVQKKKKQKTLKDEFTENQINPINKNNKHSNSLVHTRQSQSMQSVTKNIPLKVFNLKSVSRITYRRVGRY